MKKYILTGTVLLLSAQPLAAAWHQASSENFVVYADESPKDLKDFSLRLERFHSAMAAQMTSKTGKPSPSNRVTVYVVRNEKQVRQLIGGDNRFVSGFYIPRAGGSIAIVPELQQGANKVEASRSELILFHEYAHHFMFSRFSEGLPRWFSEGFAEFYGTARFESDGSVGLGAPANHRGYELGQAVNVPVPLLLDTASYIAKKSKSYDEFYGKSWALFHYLRFAPERKGQFAKYITSIVNGKSELEAAMDAFGDLKTLERDLSRYIGRPRLNYIKVAPTEMRVSDVAVKPLDLGHAAVMPLVIQSKRGVDKEQAAILLPQVRAIATKFPSSDKVLAALAEAEFDAGNDAETIEAADKALAVNASNIDALLQKANSMARQANVGKLTGDKPWSQVRAQFVKINKVENDHPVPLIRYYQTFIESGEKPTKLAVQGLEWAMQLAPFDGQLRLMVAEQQIEDGRNQQAIATLKPLAFSPHDSGLTEAAQDMIKRAEAKMSVDKKADIESESDTASE